MSSVDSIKNIFSNFQDAIKHLTEIRRKDHVNFEINDEYDVQDLSYLVLRSVFQELEFENPHFKSGGTNSRVDLMLEKEGIDIELKMIKSKDKDEKDFIKQLKIDFNDYFILGKDKKYPISNDLNLKFSDKTIDYALYNIKPSDTTEVTIGKSSELKIGDTVVIAGFPDYLQGDTITKEECKITGKTQLFCAPFYKVSGRVVHGASGGIVLNTNQQIVGIIKGGCSSDDIDNVAMKQGFVPIDIVLADIKRKTEKLYKTTGTE